MNTKTRGALKLTRFTAMVLISLCALSSRLQAQNIYKCGSSYSQTPCAGATTLSVDDARTEAQKQQTDAATRGDAKLAQSLAKDRIAQEKLTMARSPAPQPAAAPTTPQSTSNVVSKITPKRIKSKKYKPDAFIALVPGSDKKPSNKKASQKKQEKPV